MPFQNPSNIAEIASSPFFSFNSSVDQLVGAVAISVVGIVEGAQDREVAFQQRFKRQCRRHRVYLRNISADLVVRRGDFLPEVVHIVYRPVFTTSELT